MNVVLFGSTGMVGQAVLRELLRNNSVERVLSVVRHKTANVHTKLIEIAHDDFSDFSALRETFTGYDACLFCLGVSSVGLSEEQYRKITYDFTLAAARVLVSANPALRFLYVSGTGTDSTEKGRLMWARVKGKTENDLMALTSEAYMFRPSYIHPMHGIEARNKTVRVLYKIGAPLFPLWKKLFPHHVTTSEELAKAMLLVAQQGASQHIFESQDFAKILERQFSKK